ncbi:MAG: hypothetical protein IJI33_03650 [Solobacterium sp.]|nr:hypothetical protein [Solobacterium sp.]MBQ6532070.1 hypothetical protein [Solobacterium sp.]MBR0213134.1 hypothetical protein [Solobacterium sp.]
MKFSNVCPKCGSDQILMVPGDVRSYGAGNNIMTGMTVLSAVKVRRYVCCDCGFSEEWIDLDDIDKLIDRYDQ